MEAQSTENVSFYREIFSELESRPHTTIEAYTRFYEWSTQSGADPSVYLSMAITSGGLARDPELSFSDIMQGHTEFGGLMAQAIANELNCYGLTCEDIVAPADLGKVPGWGQADFLLFWAHVITGLDPREAALIDNAVRTSGVMERPGFRDKTLAREERQKDYIALIDTYVGAFENFEAGKGKNGMNPPKNMQAVVLILDHSSSLGVEAERYLCYLLGLGDYTCNLDERKLSDAARAALGRLSALGADVLPQKTDSLVISGQNRERYWKLRAKGVRWRQPGILEIIERKDREKRPPYIPPAKKSQAEQWAEYYDAELVT